MSDEGQEARCLAGDVHIGTRAAHVLAPLLWALAFAVAAVALALSYLNARDGGHSTFGSDVFTAAAILTFPTAGLLIALRRPENRLGWLYLAVVPAIGVSFLSQEYLIRTRFVAPGSLPWASFVAWLDVWMWLPALGFTFSFILLLFPDGRLPSRRWRPFAWVVVIAISLLTLSTMFAPVVVDPSTFGHYVNPYASHRFGHLLLGISNTQNVIASVLIVIAAMAPIARFRSASAVERQQLKWLAAASVGVALFFGPLSVLAAYNHVVNSLGNYLFPVVFALVPVATVIAILRYKLFDIDLIIRRTLVYGVLTVVLAALYFALVVILQRLLLGNASQLALVLSTLAIAALFNPLRQRVQRFIDRRFYRRRYDAARTVARFGATVRDEVDLSRLADELLAAVHETMQPASASLWLRARPVGAVTAAAAADAAAGSPVAPALEDEV